MVGIFFRRVQEGVGKDTSRVYFRGMKRNTEKEISTGQDFIGVLEDLHHAKKLYEYCLRQEKNRRKCVIVGVAKGAEDGPSLQNASDTLRQGKKRNLRWEGTSSYREGSKKTIGLE